MLVRKRDMYSCHVHITLPFERDRSACLIYYWVFFFRDCEDEEVQFDAESFMDTVGSLLGGVHCYNAYMPIKLNTIPICNTLGSITLIARLRQV